MNYSKSTFVVFVCLVLNVQFIFGQGPPPPPPPGLSIDGGLSFLVLSGVIYGIYSSLRKK